MLDVQQIFGRAGRPQFEDEGLGIIITQHAQLAHYLGMLTHQTPIESKFTDPLVDNLNAEIVLGKLDHTADAQAGLSCQLILLPIDQSWRDLTGSLFECVLHAATYHKRNALQPLAGSIMVHQPHRTGSM